MSEMFDDILSRRPEIRGVHDAEQARRDMLAREATESAQRMAHDEQFYGSEAARIALELADFLNQHGVESLPVYERPNGQTMKEIGRGWHTHTIRTYQGADVDPGTLRFVLLDNGSVGSCTTWRVQSDGRSGDLKGKEFNGICFPDMMNGARAHAEVTRENIKNGIASLIETGEPYLDTTVYYV